MAERLVDLGCDASRLRVHHLGIDCERFSFRERPAATAGAPLRVLAIARFVEKKGLEYAVDAIARLRAGGRAVELRVVGHGPRFDDVRARLEAGPAAGHVELLGWKRQSEVAALLDDADVLLAPSVTAADGDEEGTPTVILEAMARGLPVVSTTHSGIPEMIEDGVSGLLAPERDAGALAAHLATLADDPARRAAMGRAGRARIEREFDIERLTDALVRHYEDAAGADPPAGG
jgi:colanic acid/amylovoran biosynthesis glycosyltransferase